ncbi:MAG: hypothetical protein A3A65_02695 [Candidatus Chisholmbacteria bacterium RIFCSPLOWO2_01_FULL_49_14]|uniref:Uncharacterized protein n=1 Tax=Candidatus Chisholmbacteria bacterium RIFCSPLOWO2_01_FULL_49_14 TaxID=1797593 RepID=A0A1G1W0C2_9BACT|nr:MAG: hypothetical protein A3A65_02695 [Candidatus Chisholmbacteria bacterium RIFCSPLOWO2_01_FULL_49_14]
MWGNIEDVVRNPPKFPNAKRDQMIEQASRETKEGLSLNSKMCEVILRILCEIPPKFPIDKHDAILERARHKVEEGK